MGSIDGIILHSHCLCFSVDKGSYFILSALKHTTLKLFCLPWLPVNLMMIAGNGRTQNLCLWPPYIYLLRTMRSHTLQSDWSARHSPTNGGFGILDITMYHCAHQHGLVCAEGGHDTTFSPLTPLCVWFRGVVIQGHGVSSHDPQTFLNCTLFFDLYDPFNTPASSIPVWTSTKHFSLQICSAESSSHFIFRRPCL